MTSTTEAGPSGISERRFLHLKGVNINFTARRPNSAIFVRVHVGKETYESQAFSDKVPVAWNREIYVSSASRISITCHRKQTVTKKIHERKPFAEMIVDLKSVRIEDDSKRSFPDDEQRVLVELEFGQSKEYKKGLKLLGEDVLSAVASKFILLEKIGGISEFIGNVIEVGAAFAELNDVAKAVLGVAKILFEKLQRQRECHEAAVSLAEFVLDKLPLTEIIPEKMQSVQIRNSLEKMLKITEEAFSVLHKYADSSTFNAELGKIRDLEKKLTQASSHFSQSLAAHSYVMAQEIKRLTQENEERQKVGMLKMLDPVAAARDSKVPGCQEDTRVEVLGDITNWSEERSASSKLYWLHGFAGSGKSSIAATVCDELEAKDMLAGSFFCKRDVPEQRESGRILPSLSATLAVTCKPYSECIIKALAKDPDIASRQTNYQLTKLFREPFTELRQQEYSFERPIVFVIDALDECGADHTERSQMAQCLSQIADLADWLKIFVTSRLLPELERKFFPSPLHRSIDLNAQDSEGDIMKYTKSCLEELVVSQNLDRKWLEADVIKTISHKASGLFIWMSTVMKFVGGQYDQDAAMEKITAGQDVDPRSNLDTLYLAVVRNSRGGSDATNLSLMRVVLGIIRITARNRPLSLDGLADLMSMTERREVTRSALKAIVKDLRSVLYEDGSKGNVIRVCHPSFLDFLESQERCGEYWTNPDGLNAMMIEKCLTLMRTMLRFNICDLESSGVANKDVPNLEERIRNNIPESLQYGCLYWITHFMEANRSTVDRLIKELFGSLQVLYWIEVLSLIDGLRKGLDTLQTVDGIYKNEIARDAYKLLSSSYDAISLSTPHLYISALTWVPDESELKRLFYGRFGNQPLILSGREKRWDPALWMNTMGNEVNRVAFSPNGRHVAACSGDGTICIWEIKAGLMVMKLSGYSDPVYAISYSPDGGKLVSGSEGGAVCIWDLRTSPAIGEHLVEHTDIVTSVCYSPDGRYIASRSMDRTVKIWDSFSSSEVRTIDGLSNFGDIVYSPDGRRVAYSGLEGIIIRDPQSGELMGQLHIVDIFCLAYSPNGAYLASGDDNGTVRLWDCDLLVELAVLEGHNGGVYSVAFTPDSSQLLSGAADSVTILWDVVSKEMIGTPLRAHRAAIFSVAYSPDGLYMASGSRDKTVRVWDARSISGAESPMTERIFSIACSPSREEFASGGEGGNIRIRDVNTGAILRTLTGHTATVWAVAYSPSGKILASGSNDRSVGVWDTVTGDELHRFESHKDQISSIVFSPDGKHIFSGSRDGTVRRWQTDSSSDRGELLVNHTSAVRSLCISPNGEILAWGGDDTVIRFFDIGNGTDARQHCTSEGEIRSLSFSSDGKYVASGSVIGLIQVWETKDYSEVKRFYGHTNWVLSLSFSFDRNLVLSSGDTTIKLWNPRTGAELCVLYGHTDAVKGALFTDVERRIISASYDGTCRIWSSSLPQIGPSYVPKIYRKALSHPFPDGWIKGPTGELVLWVSPEYCDGIRDMSEVCVPADAPGHPVRLDWSKLVKGDAWTSILKAEQL